MFRITKAFSSSENGINVDDYKENSLHEDLPTIALAHGKNISAYTKLKGDELKAAKEELAQQQIVTEDQE